MKIELNKFNWWNNLVLIPETESDHVVTEQLRKVIGEQSETPFNYCSDTDLDKYPYGSIEISVHPRAPIHGIMDVIDKLRNTNEKY